MWWAFVLRSKALWATHDGASFRLQTESEDLSEFSVPWSLRGHQPWGWSSWPPWRWGEWWAIDRSLRGLGESQWNVLSWRCTHKKLWKVRPRWTNLTIPKTRQREAWLALIINLWELLLGFNWRYSRNECKFFVKSTSLVMTSFKRVSCLRKRLLNCLASRCCCSCSCRPRSCSRRRSCSRCCSCSHCRSCSRLSW